MWTQVETKKCLLFHPLHIYEWNRLTVYKSKKLKSFLFLLSKNLDVKNWHFWKVYYCEDSVDGCVGTFRFESYFFIYFLHVLTIFRPVNLISCQLLDHEKWPVLASFSLYPSNHEIVFIQIESCFIAPPHLLVDVLWIWDISLDVNGEYGLFWWFGYGNVRINVVLWC